MTCGQKAEGVAKGIGKRKEGAGQDGGGSGGQSEKIYGYIDLFKAVGDRLPLQTFPLSSTEVLLGRDPACDIRIKNARISRQQCEIRVIVEGKDFKVCLHNLTSRETTVCNNQPIPPGEQVTLHHGFRFRLYDTELRYRLYDPINEKGELDWNKPIPFARPPPPSAASKVPEPKLASAPIPTIKVQSPREDIIPGPRLRHDYRRQSFPLAENSLPNKLDLQKLRPSGRAMTFTPSTAKVISNRKFTVQKQQQQQQQQPVEVVNNRKNLLPPKAMMGMGSPPPNSYKRRGSSDFDMRKAVLQRSFRRAFKEKVINGVFTDLNDDRYRRALEDLVILSSAA